MNGSLADGLLLSSTTQPAHSATSSSSFLSASAFPLSASSFVTSAIASATSPANFNASDGNGESLYGLVELLELAANFTSAWAPTAILKISTQHANNSLANATISAVAVFECIANGNCSNSFNFTTDFDGDVLELTDSSQTSEALNVTEPSAVGNVSTASTLLIQPDLNIHHPILALFLAIMCLGVIFGNVLVMVAIKKERYLQTVTNYFVASLAAADCLVGAVVMPFSVVHEVMNKWWIFGQDWCDLWHSFDVLASTASILNLCVISLDRYWAITDPISYPSKMTSKKAKVLIAVVWACSAMISFPAIIWWRAVAPPGNPPAYQCLFTDDIGYLVFSSTISFYGPLTVMIFVYYRIYRAAVEQTRSVKLGSKQIQMSADENAVVLRIHRGGVINSSNNATNAISNSYQSCGRSKLAASPSVENASEAHLHSNNSSKKSKTSKPSKKSKASSSDNEMSTQSDNYISADGNGISEALKGTVTSAAAVAAAAASARNRNQLKAWNISRKLAKLAKEKKAAKTLGIVMGVFILCWLPFFVTNILMGVCAESCISNPDLVGSVVTWLGWVNSGMNPAIYACWSRDFRRAFKKLLCGCCARQTARRDLAATYARYSYSNDHGTTRDRPMRRPNSAMMPLASLREPIVAATHASCSAIAVAEVVQY